MELPGTQRNRQRAGRRGAAKKSIHSQAPPSCCPRSVCPRESLLASSSRSPEWCPTPSSFSFTKQNLHVVLIFLVLWEVSESLSWAGIWGLHGGLAFPDSQAHTADPPPSHTHTHAHTHHGKRAPAWPPNQGLAFNGQGGRRQLMTGRAAPSRWLGPRVKCLGRGGESESTVGASCLDRGSWGKLSQPAPMRSAGQETGCPAASRSRARGHGAGAWGSALLGGSGERAAARKRRGLPSSGQSLPSRNRSGISGCPGNEGR